MEVFVNRSCEGYIPLESRLENKGLDAFLRLREEAGINGIRNMSLDEINDEIDRTRKEIRYSDR